MKTAIGIDIGGTNIKGVLLNDTGEILYQHYLSTSDANAQWRDKVDEMVSILKGHHKNAIDVIGLSSPGLCNETNKSIAFLPNRLPGIENFNWEKHFGTNTYILNDADAALIAEAKFGALQGYKNAVLLTLGTGVGGGILIKWPGILGIPALIQTMTNKV